MKLYMFRTVPLSIIRSFVLYTQQWCICHTGFLTACEQDQDGTQFYPDLASKLSENLYDIYYCCVYSKKLLMMDRGTIRNMQTFIPRINLRNQCIQLVLSLKRPPQVLGHRRPPGVKCDPTMKMVITNAGFQSFYCQIKIHIY